MKRTFLEWLKFLRNKNKWQCYEFHPYSRFAGCKSQCDACEVKQESERLLNDDNKTK